MNKRSIFISKIRDYRSNRKEIYGDSMKLANTSTRHESGSSRIEKK